MTTSSINNGVSATLLLSVLCLGLVIMVVGGWYFQSSLVELKVQQQSSLGEFEVQQQETPQIMHHLKEEVKRQNKQIMELQLELQQILHVSLYL